MPVAVRLLASVLLAAALAACGQKSDAPKASGEVLNLYTARHYDADQQLYDAFTKATGIRVRQPRDAARPADRADEGRGRGHLPPT